MPQVLYLEDRPESGLFDESFAQPISWLARTVELVVELVVDIDVSCCLLDHFVPDPCGTGAVLTNLCSSRNRKGRMSSIWEPQYRRKVINHVRLKPKEAKATTEERKEVYMVEAENSALWRLSFASIKVLPGPSRIYSGPPLLAIAMLGKSNISSDWAQARMCWASTVQALGLIRVGLKPYFGPTFD